MSTNDEDSFNPPWPIWEDNVINSMKWSGDVKSKQQVPVFINVK